MLYSPLKIFHHRQRIDILRKGGQPVPAQVQLVITNRCNHNCRFCAYRLPGYSSSELFRASDQIEHAKVQEILDDCRDMGVGGIQLTGGGEPSVHPQFAAILADVLDRGLDLALVTNGSELSDDAIRLLSHAAWVRISLDAAKRETYNAQRRVHGEQFDSAMNAIENLAEAKAKTGSKVIIGIGFVVTAENYKEVISATELARDIGVDNIRLSAVFQSEGAKYFEGFGKKAEELCRAAEELSTQRFHVFNNFGDRLADLTQESPDYSFCGFQHFDTYIGADLNLYRCCVLAYNARGLIGSLRESNFAELWTSKQKYLDFDCFDARHCPRCMFNDKNRMIAYAIAENPPHVNFV